MARSRIDLNRFRKIYPQLKRSPRMFSVELRPYKVEFANAQSATIDIADYTTPVIVVTPEDNVNLWISSIVQIQGGQWRVTVSASSQWTGDAHFHVGEKFI